MKRETESLLIRVENNLIRTNYIKEKIDWKAESVDCEDGDETVN